MELKEKLEQLAESLTPAERACLKVLLANAVADSIDDELLVQETVRAKAYKTCVASISRLQPHRNLIPDNGIVFRGTPNFLTKEWLVKLQEESGLSRNAAIRFHDHLVVTDAPLAREFAFLPELKQLLSSAIGAVEPTGKANYIYYDQAGFGIEPHIDNEDFSLNVILMLKHEFSSLRSALVLYPFERLPEKIFLEPGELIVFFADSIIHARERMSRDEQVNIAAFGFIPS
jgi:hypothetical protein